MTFEASKFRSSGVPRETAKFLSVKLVALVAVDKDCKRLSCLERELTLNY